MASWRCSARRTAPPPLPPSGAQSRQRSLRSSSRARRSRTSWASHTPRCSSTPRSTSTLWPSPSRSPDPSGSSSRRSRTTSRSEGRLTLWRASARPLQALGVQTRAGMILVPVPVGPAGAGGEPWDAGGPAQRAARRNEAPFNCGGVHRGSERYHQPLVQVQMLQMATNHMIRVCEPLSGWGPGEL